jgi:hypothetical protein
LAELSAWAQAEGITTRDQWEARMGSGAVPDGTPKKPDYIYAGHGWTGWGDFLGTGRPAPGTMVWRPFAQARAYVRSLGLRSYEDWSAYFRTRRVPKDIPATLDVIYRGAGWVSWGDWLGTGFVSTRERAYLPFLEARAYARSLGLGCLAEWRAMSAAGQHPANIPANPWQIYTQPAGPRSGWISGPDWLGIPSGAGSRIERRMATELGALLGVTVRRWTPPVAGLGWTPQIDFLDERRRLIVEYDGARWHRDASNRLRDRRTTRALEADGWTVLRVREAPLTALGQHAVRVPANPRLPVVVQAVVRQMLALALGTVADRRRWTRYLAAGRLIAPVEPPRGWYTYPEAKALVRPHRFRNAGAFDAWVRSPAADPRMPMVPYALYADDGWVSWADFLGTGVLSPTARAATFRPYAAARAWARRSGILRSEEWMARYGAGRIPKDLPAHPHVHYSTRGWTGWGDFLGTGAKHPRDITWRPYRTARAFVRSLGLADVAAWRAYTKTRRFPKNIPVGPESVYAGKGWTGYGDWLGTGTIATHQRVHLPFAIARRTVRAYVRAHGLQVMDDYTAHLQQGTLPAGLPAHPDRTYAGQGWVSTGDWLGTGRVANARKVFRSFAASRTWARAQGFVSANHFRRACLDGKRPNDIPSAPHRTYAGRGWKGWADWLGTGQRPRRAGWSAPRSGSGV